MATYRSVFAVREFRYLYAAMSLSYVGDQFAAVAVAVLVFDQTGSGLLTAVAYASAWLPGIIGGPLLAVYADRLPRRQVLIVCDLARALLVALLVVPGMPIGVVIVLLYIAHLFAAPFTAARSALTPDILTGDAYVTGNGLTNITHQLSQVTGFAAGGVTVTLIGARGSLLVDASTFALSAVLIRVGIRNRSPQVSTDAKPSLLRESREGLRYVFTDPWLRRCLMLVWLPLAFAYAPEAVAYLYAQELGGGPRAAGLMLATPAVGYIAGAFLLTRVLRPGVRDRLIAPFAVLSTTALLPALLGPPLPVVLVLLLISGWGSSFSAPLNAIFVRRVADEYRGRAMGVAISGIRASQGLGFLTAGLLADTGMSLATVTGLCGVAGTLLGVVIALGWPRTALEPDDAPATS